MPQQLRASSSLFKSVLHYSLICMGGDAQHKFQSRRTGEQQGTGEFVVASNHVFWRSLLDNAGRPVARSYSFATAFCAVSKRASERTRAVVWHQDEGPHRHSHTHKSISHRSAGDWLSARVRERETRQSISIFLDACASDLLASEDEFFQKVPLIFEKRFWARRHVFWCILSARARNSINNYWLTN